MAEDLAYILINPYTIIKSRTGGVMVRLLARSSAELVAARMFAPRQDLINEYIKVSLSADSPKHPHIQDLIKQYLRENYAPCPQTGQRRRVMFLLFKGEDAIKRLWNEVVGHITHETVAGETIRDTYGDYIKDAGGQVKYFEPAVIMGTDSAGTSQELAVWAKYSDTDSGILKDVVHYPHEVQPESTLVLIKPDCFQWPSSRPGSIIDAFSRTGLYIIAVKVLRMSVAQALEFYGPVRDVLTKKFDSNDIAEEQFNKIIKFMTGYAPQEAVSEQERLRPGKVKCLALVYQGQDAINKIRAVLGSTDPSKAAPSTVRREFGRDVMVNTAHASDSAAAASREMGIVDLGQNDLKEIIGKFNR